MDVAPDLAREPGNFISFFLDPSMDRAIFPLIHQHVYPILGPLFRFSRAWIWVLLLHDSPPWLPMAPSRLGNAGCVRIWAAHRDRLRLFGLQQYLTQPYYPVLLNTTQVFAL